MKFNDWLNPQDSQEKTMFAEKLFQKRLELIHQKCKSFDYLSELEEDGSKVLLSGVQLTSSYIASLKESFQEVNENIDWVEQDNLTVAIIFNDYHNPYLNDESKLDIVKITIEVLGDSNKYIEISKNH
jgi:hypothetical protein